MSFQSWTEDGALRAPVFLRLRDDIDAEEGAARRGRGAAARRRRANAGDPIDDDRRAARQREERVHARGRRASRSGSPTSIASTGRPIAALQQPALTKRDLLRYLAQVSPYMLPHLADRPLTMIRMPDGIARPALLPEALGAGAAGVRRDDHGVLGPQGRAARLPAVQQPADAALARAVGHARVPRLAFAREARARCDVEEHRLRDARSKSLEASVLNYPDYVLFDIDPVHLLGQGSARAPSRSSTRSPSRRARKSRSGCASCCRACRSSRS